MPPVVKSLLIANVVAYLIDSLLHISPMFALYYWGTDAFMPYQLVTYMFMHGNFAHIFFNMFALWMFGRIMEQVWGGQRFLMYYMICGIGAGLIQEMGQMAGLISPYSMTIGASGAVYGILLAFGMTFPNERLFIIPIPFPIKAKWFICIYGLVLILFWRNAARCRNINFGKNFWRKPDSQPSMHVSYNDNYTKDYEYNSRKKARNDEIDRILDKVRQGGYESLTESEKQTLFDASGR